MSVKAPVMRYHGGKFRLAPWVMSFFPPHQTYVEPFGGAAGVLMQKPRCYSEVYNDLDSEIVTVFRVLRDPKLAEQLTEALALTPYAREEFEQSYTDSEDPVEKARRVIVRSHMGFGGAGATKGATGFRIDSARAYATASHIWAQYPDLIESFCRRLQGVIIENRDALTVIENHDRPDTLFFVDPPYVPETRVAGRYYRHEMTEAQHQALLEKLLTVRGMVVLSGYETGLYNDALSGWTKHQQNARISAHRGTGIKVESVWLNPACATKQPQTSMAI